MPSKKCFKSSDFRLFLYHARIDASSSFRRCENLLRINGAPVSTAQFKSGRRLTTANALWQG